MEGILSIQDFGEVSFFRIPQKSTSIEDLSKVIFFLSLMDKGYLEILYYSILSTIFSRKYFIYRIPLTKNILYWETSNENF